MSAQPNDCESMRFALLQRADGASNDSSNSGGSSGQASRELGVTQGSTSRDLDAHLASCAVCRRELARAAQRALLVRGLPRVLAPNTLDGAVVAALQAGVRQERAIQAIATLTPVAAPEDLARRIAVPRAPAVLDRLVGEDLADPAKALASRYARRLERLRAPEDLEHRLGRAQRRPASRLLPIALAAAGLCLTAGALVTAHLLRGSARDVPAVPSGPVLVVQRVESVRDLDPIAAQLLGSFTGGLIDAERLKREDL